MTPEGKVKAKLKNYLNSHGYYQFWPVQTGYGQPMVDCLAWAAGRALAIECKRAGVSKVTLRQAMIMRQMRIRGVQTFIVTADDQGELVWLEQKDK